LWTFWSPALAVNRRGIARDGWARRAIQKQNEPSWISEFAAGRRSFGRLSRAGAGGCPDLAREGVNLAIGARSEAALKTLADDIRRETGVSVTASAADFTSEDGRRAVVAAAPNPDILINKAGGPPPGGFRTVEHEAWVSAVDANMLTPIFQNRETIDGTIRAPLRPHHQHHDLRREVAGDLSAT
jgi:hypothetical protein